MGEVAKKARAPSGSVADDAPALAPAPLARHRVGASAPNSNWSPNLTVRAVPAGEKRTWMRRPEDANSRRTVSGSIAREGKERELGKKKNRRKTNEERKTFSSSLHSRRSLFLSFLLPQQKIMVAFPALTSADGLKALDAHLATRSYIEG